MPLRRLASVLIMTAPEGEPRFGAEKKNVGNIARYRYAMLRLKNITVENAERASAGRHLRRAAPSFGTLSRQPDGVPKQGPPRR